MYSERISIHVFSKGRLFKSKSYLVMLLLFLLITPLVFSHLATINNMYGGLWDLKAGLAVVRDKVKKDDLILMPGKMVSYANYFSDIPEKNIITYNTENLFIKDVKYIASFRSWDEDPVLKQLEHTQKRIIVENQEFDVTEIYHVGLFRLFWLGSLIPHGNVQADTLQPRFGSASVLFDGAGSHLLDR